jgi:transcriptional regulator with XRE-family HTH domain
MFIQRLQEIIDEFGDGRLTKFAKLCNIPQGTLHGYKNGRIPTAEYLIRIREVCGVTIDWLLTGVEPKYVIQKSDALPLDHDPEVASMLAMAKKVLTSGNAIAHDALDRNIKYFAHAVDAEIELDQLKLDVIEIKKELVELKRDKVRRKKKGEEQSSDEKAA